MSVCGTCGEGNPERARFCWNCGGALDAAGGVSRETRKTVTVVFADITGSTEIGERLDPETTRGLLARYFTAMREVLERHGGTVEKFIGDAVMAVFGVPTLHEDDALRAVRAANDMRTRLAELNADPIASRGASLQMRIGINTGEVVAGSGGSQLLVTGDAVNVAARLEQAAAPGEILLGAAAQQLVQAAVTTEPVEPLSLKGKTDPVPAFRLMSVTPGAGTRDGRPASPLVGRQRELRLLHEALERATAERAVHLVTLLGAAGVGKSRLVHELVTGLGDAATVLRGRCLPYGEGITYWPIGELLRSAAGISDADARDVARSKLAARLGDLPRTDEIAGHVAAAIGLSDATPSREEIFWAIRRLLGHLATERPLVVVLDDLQWAEPTLVELVEHLVEWSGEVPMLLVCMARPDLFERHPTWGGGMANATTLRLDPLTAIESEELITSLAGEGGVPAALRERVAATAEGNPLFVEEFMAMLRDTAPMGGGDGHPVAGDELAQLTVPPTIHALVSARLDRLDEPARDAIGRAAVVGQVFEGVTIRELTPEPARADVSTQLRVLVRRELVRPDPDATDEDTFRFRHIVVRDVAYGALPKEHRAELHQQLAGRLEQTAGDRLAEVEEIIAHHLEAAHRYRLELAPEDDAGRQLAARAIGHLVAAAVRARDRGDAPAAGRLFQRAVELAPPGDRRRALWLLDVSMGALMAADFDTSEAACRRMRAEAETAGDASLAALSDVLLLIQRWRRDPSLTAAAVEVPAARLVTALRDGADDLVAAVYWITMGEVSLGSCRWREAAERQARAAEAARRLGHSTLKETALRQLTNALVWGPTPSREAIETILGLRPEVGPTGGWLAVSLAQQGRAADARRELADGRAAARELGLSWLTAHSHLYGGFAEVVTGDLPAAERELAVGMELLAAGGETGVYSTMGGLRAWVLARSGRIDEAADTAAGARAATAPDDISSQTLWRMATALVASARGDHSEAERLAREAVDLMRPTDMLDLRGDAHRTLADVLDAAGRHEDAVIERQEALRLYEEKQVLPKIAELRQQLASGSGTGSNAGGSRRARRRPPDRSQER